MGYGITAGMRTNRPGLQVNTRAPGISWTDSPAAALEST
jgi:hypothetical protein